MKLYLSLAIVFLIFNLSFNKGNVSVNKDQLINKLDKLAIFLNNDTITTNSILNFFNAKVPEKYNGNTKVIELKEKIDGIKSIKLTEYPENKRPYLLDIKIDSTYTLTLPNLKKIFGKYEYVRRLHFDSEYGFIFYYPSIRSKMNYAILATIAYDDFDRKNEKKSKIKTVSFRLDQLYNLK